MVLLHSRASGTPVRPWRGALLKTKNGHSGERPLRDDQTVMRPCKRGTAPYTAHYFTNGMIGAADCPCGARVVVSVTEPTVTVALYSRPRESPSQWIRLLRKHSPILTKVCLTS
jgi:hypothetical protein